MKTKTFFSLKLYVEGLKKIKIAGIAASIAVVLLNAAVPIVNIMTRDENTSFSSAEPLQFMPFSVLMLVFSAVFSYSMFSFLNERKSSDFFHAIPNKRICVYLSFTAAILTWIFSILCISTLVNAILYGFSDTYTVNITVVLITPIVYFLASTMIVSIMTLSMTLTGTTVSNVLIFTLFLLFVRTVGQIFVACLTDLVPILRTDIGILNYFKFSFSLPVAMFDDGFRNIPLLIYTLVITVLIFAAGGFSYVFRKSESAGQSAPNRFFQTLYRSAVTLPFLLLVVFSYITSKQISSLQLFLLVLAVLAYCIFELMTTKKVKSFVKSLPLIVIPITVATMITGALFIAKNVALNDVPCVDDIAAVGERSSVNYYRCSYSQLRVEKCLVDSEEAKEIVLNVLSREIMAIRENNGRLPAIIQDNDKLGQYIGTTVQIRLKNGRTMGRFVRMTTQEYDRFMSILWNTEDYIRSYIELPAQKEIDSITLLDLSCEDVEKLWACFREEYHALSREKKTQYMEENEYIKNNEIDSFLVVGTYQLKSFTSRYTLLYEYLPKTTEMYLKMAAEQDMLQEDKKLIVEMIEELENGKAKNDQYHFNLWATELEGENRGDKFYVEAVKSEEEISIDDMVKILSFVSEKGAFCYDEERVFVRFYIALSGYYEFKTNEEGGGPYTLMEPKNVDLILSFSKEEWAEFKDLVKPYCYR